MAKYIEMEATVGVDSSAVLDGYKKPDAEENVQEQNVNNKSAEPVASV